MPSKEDHHVVGVDGSPDGWVAFEVQRGILVSLTSHADIESLTASFPGDGVVFGVDIPLAFPEGRKHRAAETQGKKILGTFSSSLFYTPPRDVLEIDSYSDANEHSKAAYGHGVSQQSFALRHKILEAVEYLEKTGDTRLYEVHPELSFKYLAETFGGEITASKKTWSGAAERYRFLEKVDLAPPLQAVSGLGKETVDDVLDSAVAAWSALRIDADEAVQIGKAAASSPGNSSLGIIFA